MVRVNGNVKAKGNATEATTRTRPAVVPPPRASGRGGKTEALALPDVTVKSSATSTFIYNMYIYYVIRLLHNYVQGKGPLVRRRAHLKLLLKRLKMNLRLTLTHLKALTILVVWKTLHLHMKKKKKNVTILHSHLFTLRRREVSPVLNRSRRGSLRWGDRRLPLRPRTYRGGGALILKCSRAQAHFRQVSFFSFYVKTSKLMF